MRQICLDTETTGLEARGWDRLVEIGCVELDGRRFTLDQKFLYHVLINPEREVPEEAVKVHGLTTERLASEPRFAEIAAGFLDFVRGAELIIHNAEFDVGFLDMELAKAGLAPIESVCKITDSLALAKKQFPGQRNTLDALCARFDIDSSARTLHGALLDAQLLAEVYISLTRGQDSLKIDMGGMTGEVELQPLPDMTLLQVVYATEEERAGHEAQLDKIDKACKGVSLWRLDPNAVQEEAAVVNEK